MTAAGEREAIPGPPALPLTPLERATGLAIGEMADVPAWPLPDGRTARAVFDDIVLEALQDGPCIVGFSGGRDSSAVLVAATAAARHHGLPVPVPVTLRFPGVASTEESEWQELVVRHLRLGDWERIEIGDELDLLGDAACDALRRHGQLWPPNAYFPAPIFRAARGGVVLNGFDGDGLFGAWPWARAQAVLHRREPLRPADVARIGWAVAPVPMRYLVETRRTLPPITWLRPRAHRRFAREWRSRKASEPRRWDRRLVWYSRWRFVHLGVHSLSLVAGDYGTRSVSPFADRQFIAAVAREGGPAGFGSRAGALRALFGDVLPPALVERRTKREFGRALWRGRAREFASRWDGTGVDPDMVDADRLRAAWAADNPAFGSATVLHGAWLASSPR